MRGSRDGDRDPLPTLKNHKNIIFLSNTGPDPLKNQKATKPALNVETTSTHHRQRADDGPLIVVFRSFLPSSTKKLKKKNGVAAAS